MGRRAMACAGGALAFATLAACVGRRVEVEVGDEHAPPAELTARPLLIPGEEAHYLLHVLEVPVGSVEMRIAAPEERDGRPITWVSTVIETAGVLEMVTSLRDEVSTAIDLATRHPIATRGKFVELLTGRPDPDAGVETPWGYPDLHHNGHTLILALRAWEAPAGTRAVTTLHSRNNTNRVELRFVGGEDLPTAIGSWPAVRVDGTILGASSEGEPFHFSLWMTDDTSRAVLRLDSDTDIGLVASARIVDYAAPSP